MFSTATKHRIIKIKMRVVVQTQGGKIIGTLLSVLLPFSHAGGLLNDAHAVG